MNMNTLEMNVAEMSELELKGILFSIIQKAKSKKKLIRYFEAVKDVEQEYDTAHNLTPEQEAELALSVAECDDLENLVPHEEAIKQIESWLKR